MPAGDFFRRIEDRVRRLVEVPLEGAAAPPLVVRDRVLEALEDRVGPALAPGEAVTGRLLVTLRAADDERRALLEEALVTNDALATAVRRRLAALGTPPAATLVVDVELIEGGEPAVAVAWERPETTDRAAGGTRYRLVVLEGTAEMTEAAFDADAAVFVGRLREVHDAAGRLVRRNDVAFADEGGVNATVSRAHAVIRRPSPAEALRVYDESTRGTSVFREGAAGLVPVRRRGLPLHDGDLVYFGDARVRFEWIREDDA